MKNHLPNTEYYYTKSRKKYGHSDPKTERSTMRLNQKDFLQYIRQSNLSKLKEISITGGKHQTTNERTEQELPRPEH